MPVDSIITTIITSVMVRISNGSNCGVPNENGTTGANQAALATLSKFMSPIAVATTPPITIPSNTEMLAMKPLAKRVIKRIEINTSDAIPKPVRSAYFGFGTEGASDIPFGMAGSAEPGDVAAAVASANHFACSGLTTDGAVGPNGLPKIQLMPMRIKLMPITAMMVPVTTGGKKRSIRLTAGAINIEIAPAPIMEPKISWAPARPGLALAIATIGATAAKVTPIMTGNRMPNHCVAPSDWINVTTPQQNKSAEIKSATCSGGNLSARPMISGTATAPAYITSTC